MASQLWRDLVHRPQRLWLRKACFQIHLWSGLVLSLYLLAIGVSGSILVFRNEITGHAYRQQFQLSNRPLQEPAPEIVVDALRRMRPAAVVVALRSPTPREPVETVFVREGRNNEVLLLDPDSLRWLADKRFEPNWLSLTHAFHADLMGGKRGRLWNGYGAIALVLVCVTGLLIWWRGLSQAVASLTMNFQLNWKRVVFDLHSAVGFWSWSLLLMWAITGISFSWPAQYRQTISSLFRVHITKTPRTTTASISMPLAALSTLMEKARQNHPGASFTGIDFPSHAQSPLLIYMTDGEAGDLLHTTYLYFDPHSGVLLGEWARGKTESLGDWLLWATVPFHYGNYWGMAPKVIWCFLGLSLPLLSFSGWLMYWNRYLRRRMQFYISHPA